MRNGSRRLLLRKRRTSPKHGEAGRDRQAARRIISLSTRSPRDKHLQRRRKSSPSGAARRSWGSGCRTASYPRTTWHPMMRQGAGRRVMGDKGGLRERHPRQCVPGRVLTRPATPRDRAVGRCAGSHALSPGVRRPDAGALPRFGAVWAGRRAPQAPLRQARSASGSDATGSLRSRTTAVLRACRARLARPRATAPEARRRHPAGEHLGQQEPKPWPTP